MTGREKRDCLHPRARHQHGTSLAYDKDGCRCWPCTHDHSRHDHAERYRTATGTSSYVPAGPARAHVEQLLQVLTLSQIEQRSGVHRTAIRVLLGDFPSRPASKRITRATEQRLLAVRADRIGAETTGLVDGTGTRRRLQALVAIGWPQKTLAERLGMLPGNLSKVIYGDAVRVATRDAVRALYDELSLTVPGPSRGATIARNLAAARDWPAPLAWDDDVLDDPAASPHSDDVDEDLVDELAIEHVLDGHRLQLTGATLHAAVHVLAAAGHQPAAIAERLGVDLRQAQRLRDRPDAPRRSTRRAA